MYNHPQPSHPWAVPPRGDKHYCMLTLPSIDIICVQIKLLQPVIKDISDQSMLLSRILKSWYIIIFPEQVNTFLCTKETRGQEMML